MTLFIDWKNVRVDKGPAAIRIGRYWMGCATGTRWTMKFRTTPERALEDAKRLEVVAEKRDTA